MIEILRSIRRIPDAELPAIADPVVGVSRPATREDLESMGIIHLHDDLYACVEQWRRDPDTLAWSQVSQVHPGVIVSAGEARDRFQRVPSPLRSELLRADVITATDPAASAQAIVDAAIAEQATAIAANVGPIGDDAETRPLVDLSAEEARIDQAERMIALKEGGLARVAVAMADVDEAADIVCASDLLPHMWAGERDTG